ncbi:MAG: gliding motility lipoprotein GldH [Bacteroidales bacterium]|jgi:gliding motility-associated lipoprotein GldH|nr:gliding motility lipoprotein GldH [Bacteroidales bacterium]
MKRSLSNKWFFLFLIIGLSSCHKGFVFSQFKEIGSTGLGKGDCFVFNVEVPDSSLCYDVNIVLRHTFSYPYRDIHLLVKEHLPGVPKDSYKKVKAQIFGREKSANLPGWNAIGVTVIPYQKGKFFPHAKGTIQIMQNMEDASLPGILEVGVEVVQK